MDKKVLLGVLLSCAACSGQEDRSFLSWLLGADYRKLTQQEAQMAR
jgi:hypothetical protein